MPDAAWPKSGQTRIRVNGIAPACSTRPMNRPLIEGTRRRVLKKPTLSNVWRCGLDELVGRGQSTVISPSASNTTGETNSWTRVPWSRGGVIAKSLAYGPAVRP